MLIEDYDTWYATWNIEDLMSERMNIKEQKRRPRARLSSVTGKSALTGRWTGIVCMIVKGCVANQY